MGYLNRIEAADEPLAVSAANDDRHERSEAAFSGLEWSVIALAQGDSIASLKEPGRIAKALGVLFGSAEHTRLADGRLEQLRRLAVLAWHRGWAVPLSELRAFKEAGFSLDQYELLQRKISGRRTAIGRRRA